MTLYLVQRYVKMDMYSRWVQRFRSVSLFMLLNADWEMTGLSVGKSSHRGDRILVAEASGEERPKEEQAKREGRCKP